MKNRIGVMQGRLLPKYQGRYQAHPLGYWKDEFSIAASMGLDIIEFILDFNDAEKNPLLSQAGADEIQQISEQTGVRVQTVCADYFMEEPLHSEDKALAERSSKIMKRLIQRAAALNISDVVVPCVDQSSLNGREEMGRFVDQLMPLINLAEKESVNLSLETDLAPQPFAELLGCFDSDRLTVNYDIGNSAALGYDPIEELDSYGFRISDIHIKDRVFGGGPVILGKGDADFDRFFYKLSEYDYQGPFIMQAYRDAEGVEVFKQQLDWIKPYLV